MSKYFIVDGRNVWNPATGIADTYLGFVRTLEADVGQPSGVGDSIADEVRIEGDVFRAFIASIAKDARLLSDGTIPPHPVMAAYVRPVLATSIVMLERAGLRVALPVDEETRMQARDLETWMVDPRD